MSLGEFPVPMRNVGVLADPDKKIVSKIIDYIFLMASSITKNKLFNFLFKSSVLLNCFDNFGSSL